MKPEVREAGKAADRIAGMQNGRNDRITQGLFLKQVHLNGTVYDRAQRGAAQ